MAGRINIHLDELKEQFTQLAGSHGDQSKIIRYLVEGYVEKKVMLLNEEILEAIDEKDFQKASELILPALKALREQRMRDGVEAARKRTKRKEGKAKEKAGIVDTKTQDYFNSMMKGFKNEHTGSDQDTKTEQATG